MLCRVEMLQELPGLERLPQSLHSLSALWEEYFSVSVLVFQVNKLFDRKLVYNYQQYNFYNQIRYASSISQMVILAM